MFGLQRLTECKPFLNNDSFHLAVTIDVIRDIIDFICVIANSFVIFLSDIKPTAKIITLTPGIGDKTLQDVPSNAPYPTKKIFYQTNKEEKN